MCFNYIYSHIDSFLSKGNTDESPFGKEAQTFLISVYLHIEYSSLSFTLTLILLSNIKMIF